MRDVRTDLAGDRSDAQRRARKVCSELAASAVRVVRAREGTEEQLVRRDAEREADAEVPVVQPGGVLSRSHRERAGDLGDLVAPRGEDEAGAALASQDPKALVDRAGDDGEVVDATEQVGVGGDVRDVRMFSERAGPLTRSVQSCRTSDAHFREDAERARHPDRVKGYVEQKSDVAL